METIRVLKADLHSTKEFLVLEGHLPLASDRVNENRASALNAKGVAFAEKTTIMGDPGHTVGMDQAKDPSLSKSNAEGTKDNHMNMDGCDRGKFSEENTENISNAPDVCENALMGANPHRVSSSNRPNSVRIGESVSKVNQGKNAANRNQRRPPRNFANFFTGDVTM
nr:hypothetical protein Iba_chr13cCG8240 [Ipomoea batatas]